MNPFRRIRAFFYPERCPYCGRLVESEEIACADCRDELARKHKAIISGAGGFRCVSSFIYGGKVRRMILRVKYHERTQYTPQIAAILAEDILETYGKGSFDLITAVPMHPKDLKERGYNQSALLAKALSARLDLPYRDTLCKIKRTKKQHTLKYADRKKNLSGAFGLIDKDALKGKRILIIDDIITSGFTLTACCKTLNRAKPSLICCASIANAKHHYPSSAVI